MKSFWSAQTKWGFWRKPMRQTFDEATYSMLHLCPGKDQKAIYDRFVYESGRAAFETGYWPFDRHGASKVDESKVTCPMLIIAGAQDTISYLLFGLAVEHYQPDAATDAQAIWLKRRQAPNGQWPIQTIRPPIESNDIEVTAVSLRALQAFAPPAQRAEYAKSVERAAQWLTLDGMIAATFVGVRTHQRSRVGITAEREHVEIGPLVFCRAQNEQCLAVRGD